MNRPKLPKTPTGIRRKESCGETPIAILRLAIDKLHQLRTLWRLAARHEIIPILPHRSEDIVMQAGISPLRRFTITSSNSAGRIGSSLARLWKSVQIHAVRPYRRMERRLWRRFLGDHLPAASTHRVVIYTQPPG
jgi:hypothetical protein